MKTLYFQTDTTDRYQFRQPIEDDSQPHLVRLAWIVADDSFRALRSWSRLITPRPDWEYADDAVVGHGVTREAAEATGQRLESAMATFVAELERVDRVCAFNADFHRKVAEHAAFESGRDWVDMFANTPVSCAMRESTDIVRKPRMAPGGGYSWPKLKEAFEFFHGDDLPPLDMAPEQRGLALATCVLLIDRGIHDYQRQLTRGVSQ